MHHLNIRHALHGVLVAFAIAAIPGHAAAQPAPAPAAPQPAVSGPFRLKVNHVQYEVKADLSYAEHDEIQLVVLSPMGIQIASHLPVGGQNMLGTDAIADLEIQILDAYMLKKSGQRIPAAAGVAIPPAMSANAKWLSFQNAEVGDTLVISANIVQKEAMPPGNIVIKEIFQKIAPIDDLQISLSAPAALKLRINVSGFQPVQPARAGDVQTWVWKYQNSTPAMPRPGTPFMDNLLLIHVSSFPDDAAEKEAFKNALLPPMTEQNRCPPLTTQNGDIQADVYMLAGYFWGDARRLERTIDGWNIPSCVYFDGRPRLAALRGAFDAAFSREQDWTKIYARIQELKKQFPNKTFVALAEADYWIVYAWDARGNGYASSVTQDGWKLFRERLEKAEKVLLDSKDYASANPIWYDEMLTVQSALDRSGDEKTKTFLEGAKKSETYYPLYFTMLNYMLPKWGGSWATVDSFVQWSVDNTKDVDGNSLYARLYWSAYQGLRPEERLFKDTRASWPKMKKGFEDMMARHPQSKWNLNNFAMFACMAGDKKTFRALRKQIGKDVAEDAWQGSETLDLCEAKYGA